MEPTQYPDIAMKLASLLDVLSHPARVKILLHLSKYKNCPAGNISSQLPLCKSTVSQHMAKLKEAGLISCTPDGVCQNYRIQDNNISQAKTLFLDFFRQLEVSEELKKECKQDAPETSTNCIL